MFYVMNWKETEGNRQEKSESEWEVRNGSRRGEAISSSDGTRSRVGTAQS